MLDDSKIIRDPIHGDIKLKGIFLDLIDAPEIQRLYNIKQLGFAHLVFPGAHHTRLEHSLGTYYMAYKASEKLNLEKEEKEIIQCAAFLHDIGHGPFSHTLESILRETLNVDHIDLTEKLICGKHTIFDEIEKNHIGSLSVNEVLNKNGIDTNEISDIIRGKKIKKHYLSELLNSAIDVDQLDYLVRDAYYTGVAYGMIDIDRFLQTLIVKNNRLAVLKKGVSVIENILMARSLMYSSVYFHKTVRISELMLSKAIELINKSEPFVFFKMTDTELLNDLKKMGDYQNEIATRLKYRRLFKQAYTISEKELIKIDKSIVKKFENIKFRRQKEEDFEKILKIPKGHIIIDIPHKELKQTEPRIDDIEIPILDDGKIKKLDDFTPVARAIKSRLIPDWAIMIITDEKYKDIVSKNAEKILFK